MRLDPNFGRFGGRFVPELLVPILDAIEAAWIDAREDEAFGAELSRLLADFAGRPTPLYRSRALSEAAGCDVWLKREDLLHGGAHKTNNTVGQALLAKRMGKRRLIAETGAGQHGVATAMAGALLGMEVEIFMGAHDVERQRPNVQRMELFGASVRAIEAGSRSLKDAINEAMRDWTERVDDTFYVFGTAAGPHPFPTIVRELQRVIGDEIREQLLEACGALPTHVVACVGGGSNAIGAFAPFFGDTEVALVGVEPAGRGLTSGAHGAPLSKGSVGCLHGSVSYVLQDSDGQIREAHSVSAGLDYPGVGPEHAFLRDTRRARYVAVTDEDALDAFRWLSREEGILPALETAHAVAFVRSMQARPDDRVVINLSGRGDKDLDHVMRQGAASDTHETLPSAQPASNPLLETSPLLTSPFQTLPTRAQLFSPEDAAARSDRARLGRTLSALRAAGEGAFMPFLVVGDPSLDATVTFADALVSAGADAIEFGLAYSDPPADGPVIQAADVRALERGVTVAEGLVTIASVRDRHPSVPITMLVYANLVMQRGVERFYSDAAAAGVDAVLVADVPLEAAGPFVDAARAAGVAPVFVVSRLTSEERIRALAEVAEGYFYLVARVGVTGERSAVSDDLSEVVARVRRHSSLPVLAGFGIATPDHVRAVRAAGADGAICGSAIVRRIEASVSAPLRAASAVHEIAASLKAATRS